MSRGFYIVEFLGGPFDGDAFVVSRPPTVGQVAIPVSPRLDDSGLQRPFVSRRPSSFAVYQLKSSSNGWSYRFVKSMPADDRQFDASEISGQHVPMIEAPPASDAFDRLARAIGFVSKVALFEASLFVGSGGKRNWFVTVDDRGAWWAWNDRDPHDFESFSSLDEAVGWVRQAARGMTAARRQVEAD
jgi:hypothetical protein